MVVQSGIDTTVHQSSGVLETVSRFAQGSSRAGGEGQRVERTKQAGALLDSTSEEDRRKLCQHIK